MNPSGCRRTRHVRHWAPAIWLVLLVACDQGELQRKLAPEALGRDVVEFYLPPDAGQQLGDVVAAELASREVDSLRIEVPALEGSLGDPLAFATGPVTFALPVSGVDCSPQAGRFDAMLDLEPIEVSLAVEVFSEGEPLKTCFVDLVIPARQVQGVLAWGHDADDAPVVVVEGPTGVEGEPVSWALPVDCPQQPGGEFEAVVDQAFQDAQAVAANQLVASVAEALGAATGVDAGGGASIQAPVQDGLLHVELGCWRDAVNAEADEVTVRLVGGFESSRAACVAPDVPVPPPGSEPRASFDQRVPRTGESYTLGVSVSRGMLAQGLASAHRAGWFCRYPSTGELAGVSLEGMLPSLDAVGKVRGVRLALWPVSAPTLDLDGPFLDAGEKLPRLKISFERLDVDIYTELEGADLRVLGLSASVALELVPRLEGQALGLQLGRVDITDLEVTYAELPAESETVLRSVAATLLEQAAAALVGEIQPVQLDRPAAAAGEMLGARLTDDRVLLYFCP